MWIVQVKPSRLWPSAWSDGSCGSPFSRRRQRTCAPAPSCRRYTTTRRRSRLRLAEAAALTPRCRRCSVCRTALPPWPTARTQPADCAKGRSVEHPQDRFHDLRQSRGGWPVGVPGENRCEIRNHGSSVSRGRFITTKPCRGRVVHHRFGDHFSDRALTEELIPRVRAWTFGVEGFLSASMAAVEQSKTAHGKHRDAGGLGDDAHAEG